MICTVMSGNGARTGTGITLQMVLSIQRDRRLVYTRLFVAGASVIKSVSVGQRPVIEGAKTERSDDDLGLRLVKTF